MSLCTYESVSEVLLGCVELLLKLGDQFLRRVVAFLGVLELFVLTELLLL